MPRKPLSDHMRRTGLLAAGLILLVASIILSFSGGDSYSLAGGISWMMDLGARPLYSPSDLADYSPEETVLIVIWPGEWDWNVLEDYAMKGGIVIALGAEWASNAWAPACIVGSRVRDPLYYLGDPGTPLAETILGGRLAVPNATSMRCESWEPWAWTSNFSYLDLDGDGYYSSTDVMGSYTVAVWRPLGSGSLIVVSSRDVLVGEAGVHNKWLLEHYNNRTILVDQTLYSDDIVARARTAGGSGSLEAILAAVGVAVVVYYAAKKA